jgi:GNAT superfamily N-acetyltransferase
MVQKVGGTIWVETDDVVVVNTRAEHAEACAMLEQLCYPTLSEEEKLRAEQFLRHIELFPEGQFVALDKKENKVIGATGGFITTFENVATLNFFDVCSKGWFDRHDPTCDYYYGATMTVHPRYRGRGIARLFYTARKTLTRQLGLKGQVIVGMIPGYGIYRQHIPADEYVKYVIAGLLYDPTLTIQTRNGFEYRDMLKEYFDDPPSEGWGVLLECESSD